MRALLSDLTAKGNVWAKAPINHHLLAHERHLPRDIDPGAVALRQ
jgi:hypothetical protein